VSETTTPSDRPPTDDHEPVRRADRPLLMRTGFWLLVALAVGLAAAIVLRAQQASEPAAEDPTVEELREELGVPVEVAAARMGPIENWQRYSGTVSGAREAVVRARTDNAISRVRAELGDQVRRGQVLVELSGEGIEARRRQAETAYQQASRRKDRLEALHEEGAISAQEWEDVVTAYEMARDDLAAARDALFLDSPLAGTVTEVIARPGMVPNAGDPLIRVADLSERIVRLRVNASAARALEVGQPARTQDGQAAGQVSRIALHADPATRLVEVEIAFPPDAPLFPGTLETVDVRTDARDAALIVPRAAVRESAVWIVDDESRAQRRLVTTGLMDDEAVEIEDGVAPGERVIVRGTSALREGALVRVVDPDEAA
jgi:RND family efflux transporter MFP subunit